MKVPVPVFELAILEPEQDPKYFIRIRNTDERKSRRGVGQSQVSNFLSEARTLLIFIEPLLPEGVRYQYPYLCNNLNKFWVIKKEKIFRVWLQKKKS